MKHIFITLVLFCSASAMACGIHQFKVPLNQRGFYNPAAVCPYCQGSMYFATGAFAGINSNDLGMFVTLGHDGNNSLHGAWDMTYSYSSGTDNSLRSYSTRYAWKQDVGSWALAGGMRASYYNYSMLLVTPESYVAKSSRNCFNFDAGIMVTDQRGFYAGISILNLHQPTLTMQFELPGQTQYYDVKTKRTYVASTGGLVNLNRHFDLMLDASGSVTSDNGCVRPSAMVRYHRHLAIGSAVTVQSDGKPVYEVQGGYTSTSFKWLSGIAFSDEGPVVETGIVVRFGVQRWRVTKIQGDCISIPTPEPRTTEFTPED